MCERFHSEVNLVRGGRQGSRNEDDVEEDGDFCRGWRGDRRRGKDPSARVVGVEND